MTKAITAPGRPAEKSHLSYPERIDRLEKLQAEFRAILADLKAQVLEYTS